MPPAGQEGDLLQGGVRPEAGHEQGRLRHLVRPQHAVPVAGGAGMVSQRGVSVAPAESTPTRTPWGRISSASTREKPSSPYLDAV